MKTKIIAILGLSLILASVSVAVIPKATSSGVNTQAAINAAETAQLRQINGCLTTLDDISGRMKNKGYARNNPGRMQIQNELKAIKTKISTITPTTNNRARYDVVSASINYFIDGVSAMIGSLK